MTSKNKWLTGSQALAEIRMLEAEIERLRTIGDQMRAQLDASTEAMSAAGEEIERLRAALTEVATISHTSLLPDRVVEIVTAALDPRHKGTGAGLTPRKT